MKDINKHRRQVAWKCFQPHLNEEQLLEAIRILEKGYQTEGTINLINYIKKVCNQFDIGEQVRKAMHLEFHQLMLVPFESTEDPLSRLTEREKPGLSASPEIPSGTASPAPGEQQPAHTTLFSLLTDQVVEYCHQTEEFFMVLTELVHDDKKQRLAFADSIAQWAEKPCNYSWAVDLDEQALTRLVHLIYTAVCEILGPVEADHCFHMALAVCEKRPEARQFAPARFF